MISLIQNPYDTYRLGDFLLLNLQNPKWEQFRAAVAFAKKSGTSYIKDALSKFALSKSAIITVGIDHGGTSYEALDQLMSCVSPKGTLWVYKNPIHTFHPKVFLFRNSTEADVLIGSGNLTKGGLFENAEVGMRVQLDLNESAHLMFYKRLEAILDAWSSPTTGQCLRVDSAVLQLLEQSGDVPSESEANSAYAASNAALKKGNASQSPFKSLAVPPAPPLPRSSSATSGIAQAPAAYATSPIPPSHNPSPLNSVTQQISFSLPNQITFGMTLQNTDVGFGQTTTGTSKRSPEIFVPLKAMDVMPGFWGWHNSNTPNPALYQIDSIWRAKNLPWISAKTGTRRARPVDKFDWHNVQIHLQGHLGLLTAQFWYNPKKRDIRMRENTLRASGSVGDILLVRQSAQGALHQYDMEIIPTSSPMHGQILAKLTHKVTKSQKRFGYF